MPKYLITATAYRRAEGSEAYAPRTFTFEAVLDAPWNGKNAAPVGDMAFDQCHRTFGWWPKHNPQIDSVVETGGLLPEDLSSRLAAAALMDGDEISALLVDLQAWDAANRVPVTPVDWSDAEGVLKHGNPETPPPAEDDLDELI